MRLLAQVRIAGALQPPFTEHLQRCPARKKQRKRPSPFVCFTQFSRLLSLSVGHNHQVSPLVASPHRTMRSTGESACLAEAELDPCTHCGVEQCHESASWAELSHTAEQVKPGTCDEVCDETAGPIRQRPSVVLLPSSQQPPIYGGQANNR